MHGKKNIIIKPEPEDLFLSPAQIARYAGGSRYRMDAAMEKTAGAILDKAKELVSPAAVYAVHDLSGLKKDILERFAIPETCDDIFQLCVCICTLGAKLEKQVSKMMKIGSGLEAVFLDAAGVGLLESLGNLSFSHICAQARKDDLFAGCRLGPGYGNVSMNIQKHLFSMVDSSGIGVSLTDSMVMVPAKSLSFFVFFHQKPQKEADGYKCSKCSLENCLYRIAEK
jgi:hypothetical protein